MIRKPQDRELRDGAAVSTLRDARTLAVEGARGVGQGTASVVKWWLLLVAGFAFLASIGDNFGAVGMLVVMAGAVAWFLRGRAAKGRGEGVRRASPRTVAPELVGSNGAYEVSVGAIGRTAARYGVPAILLFPTSGMFSFMAPLTLFGIVFLALAILNLARLSGDRTLFRYDANALTVRGVLGEARILWDDVDDVTMRTYSRFNLAVLFTSGNRRNIVITAARNRLDGPTRLLIPHPLLDLDQEALIALVTKLVMMQAGHGDLVDIAIATPGNALSAPAKAPVRDTADIPFDADAIMQRYMAEREAVVANARPAPLANARPVFGRKVV